MPEQVAPPPAPDAATPEPAVETPQAAAPQQAKPESATETPQPAAPQQQPAGSEPAVETPQAAEPKAEKSGGKKVLGIVGAILAVVVIAGLKFGVASAIGNYFNKDETADAKTGDCIAELPEVTGTEQEEVDGAKVVECTSTDAAYNVVGRVDGQSEAQAKADTTCTQFFKENEEGYIFSSIEPGKTGYVLCLTKKV
ncbi:LppU/SCO3897 family protein [Micromonospora vinacea]|uniref:LppU/SCO3897 family protein n=1 Tax=Micromonospora vinacea TaxID=709878 RepID=UPI003D8C0CEA